VLFELISALHTELKTSAFPPAQKTIIKRTFEKKT